MPWTPGHVMGLCKQGGLRLTLPMNACPGPQAMSWASELTQAALARQRTGDYEEAEKLFQAQCCPMTQPYTNHTNLGCPNPLAPT